MEIDASLVGLLSKDEVVRHITQVQSCSHSCMHVLSCLMLWLSVIVLAQMYCLERLANGDLITARSLLTAMVQVGCLPHLPVRHILSSYHLRMAPCAAGLLLRGQWCPCKSPPIALPDPWKERTWGKRMLCLIRRWSG
jgi:hypothetical protein